MIGRIVCSKAGRDKDCFMAVIRCEEGKAFVCDGKRRPLERPKGKNIKHLKFTNTYLDREQMATNRSLRRALNDIRGNVLCIKEEN
ncbi:MAG: KOW domain-containing RNA-binding protein [Clostridia bacterium]|nr:KOW domain-containing RNA-binding protein [Clostridia bacterium]